MDERTCRIADALGDLGARGELGEFLAQGEASGWCARPVKLVGYLAAEEPESGRRVVVSQSGTRPGGVIRKACGNRRASVCPSCSSLYRSDARG